MSFITLNSRSSYILFSCSYQIDTDTIEYALTTKVFKKDFIDKYDVTSELVGKIICSKDSLQFIVDELDSYVCIQNINETPEELFCSAVMNVITDNLDAIKSILDEQGAEE